MRSRSARLERKQPVLPGYAGGTGTTGARTGARVARGSGTPEDPFVIEGWTIDARGHPGAPGIHIRGTSAHAIVQDCLVLKEKHGKGILILAETDLDTGLKKTIEWARDLWV